MRRFSCTVLLCAFSGPLSGGTASQVAQVEHLTPVTVSQKLADSFLRSSPSLATPLAQCIVQRESGDNPSYDDGTYQGIANWDANAWQNDGGLRYASSPTGATRSQQVTILNQALADGKSYQWTPFDGC